ncbi:flagellar biogenesis protein FliO [Saonia flava]|uniref:Flagellar biogenesis protein FliO n=1 Tax=Saonia flava TaxID=523696 RepID=A0A846QXQ0_9FLAO|nr:hypothetical protein [Saonia flava]NJB71003.1 flagellar biogenesis protein FliO [Saonia flava]
MHKFLKIGLVVLSLIGVVLWFMLPSRELSEANPTEAINSGAMNFMFILTYLLLAIAVIASLFFAFKGLFSTPGSLKKALYIIGGLLLIVGISYGLASGTDVADEYMSMTTESTVKKIGMGLNVFFILTIIAVLAMIVPGIKRMFSK